MPSTSFDECLSPPPNFPNEVKISGVWKVGGGTPDSLLDLKKNGLSQVNLKIERPTDVLPVNMCCLPSHVSSSEDCTFFHWTNDDRKCQHPKAEKNVKKISNGKCPKNEGSVENQ